MADRNQIVAQDDQPIALRDIVVATEGVENYVSDTHRLAGLREALVAGDVVVLKSFATQQEIRQLVSYLHGVMQVSMEEYVPRREGARNHFRISFDDERAVVRAWFASWSFFPWNQDLFLLYHRYAAVYHLRNLLSGLPPSTFLGRRAEMGCCARLAAQFYPRGKGYMAAHVDPYDKHQVVVPIMPMSRRGADFQTGGSFVGRSNGQRISIEDFAEPGDIVLFHSRCVHGVETIDPEAEYDPLSAAGRWILLFGVNKLSANTEITDARMFQGY